MSWHLHWLRASGDLRYWSETIHEEVEIARNAIAGMMLVPTLDILIEHRPGATIPEIGMVGQAYNANLFAMTFDPDNPNFARSLRGGLRCLIAHEAHHCPRMVGPGYGKTLGAELVSEGLAGEFVSHLFGTPPAPWECAVVDEILQANLPSNAMRASDDHDHGAWFYGTGGRYPRCLGTRSAFGLLLIGLKRGKDRRHCLGQHPRA